LDAAGRVDRLKVAEIVFTNDRNRRDLEARIHPLVRREIERRFAAAGKSGARVAVAEVSQLLEARTESDYDRVLFVTAPRAERIRRWQASGGAAGDAERRISSQIPPEEASRRVTDVIVNDGALEELKRKVGALYKTWLADPRSGE